MNPKNRNCPRWIHVHFAAFKVSPFRSPSNRKIFIAPTWCEIMQVLDPASSRIDHEIKILIIGNFQDENLSTWLKIKNHRREFKRVS